jgi:hypothetical protein
MDPTCDDGSPGPAYGSQSASLLCAVGAVFTVGNVRIRYGALASRQEQACRSRDRAW